MILALNAGFYNTKVKTASSREFHPTRVQISDNGIRTLILGDTCYEIGVGTRDINDKRFSKVHSLCTKYNLLKHATSDQVQLVTSLPMSLYLNKTYRDDYRISLFGRHSGIVDGVRREIVVTDHTVFAEGPAAYLCHKHELKDKVVGVIDIGGNTVIAMIYEYGNLLKETITTMDLGMIKLERAIMDEMNVRYNWNLQEYEVKEIMRANEYRDYVDKIIRGHVNKIKNNLLEKKWNLERIPVFGTGGGIAELKEYMVEGFKNLTVSSEPIFDTVDGLYLVGRELYGKETYQHNKW